MANLHSDSGIDYAGHAYAAANALRRPMFPAIRWGAVLAGVAVGVSIQLVLTLLGIATGLSTSSASEGDGVGMGPLIWAGLSMLIAAFIGGYVAARLTGLKRKADGVLHGVVTWAVTTLLFASLATSATGSMVNSIFTNVGSAATRTGAAAVESPSRTPGVLGMLKSQIGGNVSPESLGQLQDYIQAGQREQAIRHMTGSMGVEQSRAETIVDQALILSGSPEQASEPGRASADRALDTASKAAWAVFGAVALSMLLGIIGGVLGAISARRTTWTDADSASAAA
ncbi:hypothetical protein Q8A64_08585 [Oxalobacteraceae bacterium R-40]|uniref:PhnA-like protein n=1 Tax=Keguizhuia sedimenti TaxID=3064264 RepID=A0ABU1BR35_9BURK|nr:hypothetical protein [Oxalobacteraceae bacterium R-40]